MAEGLSTTKDRSFINDFLSADGFAVVSGTSYAKAMPNMVLLGTCVSRRP